MTDERAPEVRHPWKWIPWAFTTTVLAGLLMLFLIDLAAGKALRPPEEVKSFSDYLRLMQPPERVYEVPTTGGVHLLCAGRRGRWLASGPPVYAFQPGGGLVAWTPDVGDDATFSERWWYARKAITLDEARRRFR